jgi:hypothetical protein
LLLAALLFVPGCGSKGPKNYVVGKVTVKGQPATGTIAFIGSDGKEVVSPIGPDGSYMIPDPPLGDAKIAVRGMPGMISGPPPNTPKELTKDMPGNTSAPTMGVPPPAKYANPTNGLTFKVTGGKQTHDIDLTP